VTSSCASYPKRAGNARSIVAASPAASVTACSAAAGWAASSRISGSRVMWASPASGQEPGSATDKTALRTQTHRARERAARPSIARTALGTSGAEKRTVPRRRAIGRPTRQVQGAGDTARQHAGDRLRGRSGRRPSRGCSTPRCAPGRPRRPASSPGSACWSSFGQRCERVPALPEGRTTMWGYGHWRTTPRLPAPCLRAVEGEAPRMPITLRCRPVVCWCCRRVLGVGRHRAAGRFDAVVDHAAQPLDRSGGGVRSMPSWTSSTCSASRIGTARTIAPGIGPPRSTDDRPSGLADLIPPLLAPAFRSRPSARARRGARRGRGH
jgi:hypothetical protein